MSHQVIASAFEKGKAFIPFITCGDPDLDTSAALITAMARAGADLIELGIPFSDPTAEGPVIQAANERALAAGTTTERVFAMLEGLSCPVPLLFMTYANIVFAYGPARFAARCAQVGIVGVILPDVPFEERAEFEGAFEAEGITLISMVAPSSKARIRRIAQGAEGFVYTVSSLGVTGERSELAPGGLNDMIAQLREATKTPLAVGFGVSTPEQAREIAKIADGVIVGSAIVRLIGEHGRAALQPVSDYVAAMKAAVSGR